MVQSVIDTSQAHVLLRTDADDRESEDIVRWSAPRIHVLSGPPSGRGAAINECCEYWKDYRAYLLVSDDVVFTRQGWDREVMSAMDGFGDDIGVVHLSTGIPEAWVNWPCVSRKWIDAVGWFHWPKLKSYFQDTILQSLGCSLERIRYIEPPCLRHDCMESPTGASHYQQDMMQFPYFFATEFGPTLKRLRAVMS